MIKLGRGGFKERTLFSDYGDSRSRCSVQKSLQLSSDLTKKLIPTH